jgi:putative sterol carrier protein
MKLNIIFFATSFIPVIVFKSIARVGTANLAQARLATVIGLTLAVIHFALSKRYVKHISYLDWAFLGYLALGTAWVYLAPTEISSFFVDNSIAILYFVLVLTALIPQFFGYAPFTYAAAKRIMPEHTWTTPHFRAINLHLTYFWSGILFICFLSSWLGHGKPLFSIVIPLAIILSIGIPVSRFYPNYYLKRQYGPQQLDLSLLPATARELILQMPLGFDPVLAGGLEADIQFDLSGDGGGKIVLSVSNGQCTAWEGETASPNLTIHSPTDVWLKVASRQINPGIAFINGLYQAEGDMELLVKIRELFRLPVKAKEENVTTRVEKNNRFQQR